MCASRDVFNLCGILLPASIGVLEHVFLQSLLKNHGALAAVQETASIKGRDIRHSFSSNTVTSTLDLLEVQSHTNCCFLLLESCLS